MYHSIYMYHSYCIITISLTIIQALPYLTPAHTHIHVIYLYMVYRWACQVGNIDLATYLLGQGADVTLANKKGQTALILARINGFRAVANLLLSYGAV